MKFDLSQGVVITIKGFNIRRVYRQALFFYIKGSLYSYKMVNWHWKVYTILSQNENFTLL